MELPEILYVDDFAALLRISPAALRRRALRGQLPAPFHCGRALAWTRDRVLSWLRDCGRSAGPADMRITLRPYSHDKTRWHVDIRLMNPCNPEREIRRRTVAPAGMSEAQARAWGERQVPTILRKALGATARDEKEAPNDTHPIRIATKPHRPEMTVARLFIERFEPEHVRLQKPATQDAYAAVFRNHIGPLLGDMPIEALDEDRLSAFRAELAGRVRPVAANLVLAKLAKLLRFAKRVRLLAVVPEIEKLRTPRPKPKPVYSDGQIADLLAAARSLGPVCELICLLALDAGLRTSEVCALEWGDVDLDAGTLLVQHNAYRGVTQTPKGTIGKLALTKALWQALLDHRRREPLGPLVLYRRYQYRDAWRPFSPSGVRHVLNQAQEKAGLPKTGLHLLRHTSLTRLANLGASVYIVQAVARHSRLQTTQMYLHTQQVLLSREAADLLDQAARGHEPGKALAKRAKSRRSKS
ncbi:MAG: site-specific integrase [Myxococcales bacterium]|nr:site-specific integrase [Myxococcales bacterium]